jgi:hydrogenase maturation protein HypF
MIRELVKQRDSGIEVSTLAAMFMNTLVQMAVEQVRQAVKETEIRQVVLSGGTFQNQYLMTRLPALLKRDAIEVYWHRRVSCNDEGLALGQMMIGNLRLK